MARFTAVVLSMTALLLVGCNGSTSSTVKGTPSKPTPTPLPTPAPTAAGVTFNSSCGPSEYMEPAPPGHPYPTPSSSPVVTPMDAYGSPVTTQDALAVAHRMMKTLKALTKSTVTCAVASFSPSQVQPYISQDVTIEGSSVFVVAAHVQPSAKGSSASEYFVFISSTRPTFIYSVATYPAGFTPAILQGL